MDSSAHFRSASCSHNNCTNILLDPQRPNSVESDSGKGTSYQLISKNLFVFLWLLSDRQYEE